MQSKSRVNFLTLLQQEKQQHYVFSTEALEYMKQQKLPRYIRGQLEGTNVTGDNQAVLTQWLIGKGMTGPRHQRIIVSNPNGLSVTATR